MPKNRYIPDFILHQPRWRLAAAAALVALAVFLLRPSRPLQDVGTTFVARRGPLDITILDGGGLESEEKGEIKCEVKGGQGVKILKIVEEGYQVSDEDVRTNKVLVELDSADLRSKITQQEITLGSTVASLIDAEQAYDIQLNQNLSDVKTAEQKATFARMDFDKYLGDRAANEILVHLGYPTQFHDEGVTPTNLVPRTIPDPGSAAPVLGRSEMGPTHGSTNGASSAGVVLPTLTSGHGANGSTTNSLLTSQTLTLVNASSTASNTNTATIDFAKYADPSLLGDGEAKQKLRELQDTVQIAQKELQQAQSTLEGTRRLFEKDFVTKIELDRDQLTYDNSVLKVKKADTALNLFSKYEFRKAAQEGLSKYTESLREMDRTKKGAISKLAQAEAKLKAAQARYSVEERQLKELKEQLDKCIIKAPRPGLVVYGSGGEVRYWRDEEQIREGVTVREGQTILTIPDMRKMCIKVRIHESYIKKVAKGQKVHITADAFPDRKLEGEVSQVGVLPDSENAWLNPDMKVYRTTIVIKGQHDWIRPGMSTKVQIVVNHLPDVVHVPLQAVSPMEDKRVCYVLHGEKLERREVEVGEFNDEFIEIKRGITEGEKVCLRTPEGHDEGTADKEGTKTKSKEPSEKEPAKSEKKVASQSGATAAQ